MTRPITTESAIAGLTIGALGIVYGDLGTSPLYTIRECFNPVFGLAPSETNILGVLSLIFWSLVLVVIVKYIFFIMRADNNGEGGILSLLSLVISGREKEKRMVPLILIGLVGTTLLLSEGMITPAISVLSAVEGLEVSSPFLSPFIIPIAIAILCLLFLFQKHGTHRIGRIFGPIMVVWFFTIGTLGLLSIVQELQVLRAINPWYAVRFFLANGTPGTVVLGSVVLAITGTEALYADLGHFGKKPIRRAWFSLVMPALVLNYFGQGAAILRYGEKAMANPFYFLAPGWFLIVLIVIATAAAIIASQALISGSFSMVQQVIQLGYLPKLKIVHTSEDVRGQIFIPLVNYLLLVLCIFLVVFFRNSSSLASAYGISVMGTMLCSSILYSRLMERWNWNPIGRIALFLLFITVDLIFLSANLSKVLSGGWFTILAASLIFTLMQSWKWGSLRLVESMRKGNIPLEALLESLSEEKNRVIRTPGTGVFMIGNPNTRFNVLLHHLKHNRVLQERVVLLSIVSETVPYVRPENRIKFSAHAHGFFEITSSFGYMEKPTIFDIAESCLLAGFTLDVYQTSFYVGRVSVKITPGKHGPRWLSHLYRFMQRNAEPATAFFELPPGSVVELGTQVVL